MKHCVIHYGTLQKEARVVSRLQKRAQHALDVIDAIVNDCSKEVIFVDDFRFNEFSLGDEAMLYGCYVGMCLGKAERDLTSKGVRVVYNQEGCV